MFNTYYQGEAYPTLVTALSQDLGAITAPLQPTQAELAISPTLVVNPGYLPGNMLRYGIVPNSVGAGANNLAILIALFNPSVAGPTGDFFFPQVTGADVYTFGAVGGGTPPTVPMRPGIRLTGYGVTINVIGTSSANDVNVGFLYALSDCVFEQLTINSSVNTAAGVNAAACIYGGARGPGHYYSVTESTLPVPLGNIFIRNCKLSIAGNTGGNSAPPITMLGNAATNSVIENCTLNCGNLGTISAFYYEWGIWSGSGAVPSNAVVTTHAKNFRWTNNTVLNCGGPAVGITGMESFHLDGLYTTSSAQGFVYSVGQAMFYNVPAGDTAGQKRGAKISRIIAQGVTATAIQLAGSNVQGGFTPQQQTDLMTFEVDNCSTTGSTGIVIGGTHTTVRLCHFDASGTGLNPVVINDDCTFARMEECSIIGGTGAGLRADIASTGAWSPVRQKRLIFENCLFAGNLYGAEMNNVSGAKFVNCQFGYNALYDGAGNEATQTVGVLCDSGCNGVIVENCTCTNAGGGGNMVQTTGVASSGNNLVNPILIANGTIASSGNWDFNGVAQAATGTASTGTNAPGIANKTSYPNLGYKYLGKMCICSSNGVLYVAGGSSSTATWTPVYGVSLFAAITPA